MRGLIGAMVIGASMVCGAAQAEQRANQESNAAMMGLGAAMAIDLLEKGANLCFSQAMFVVRGYELREKKEQLKAQLEGDFKSLPEEYKSLLLRGASLSRLDQKELSAEFDQCVKKAVEQISEALRH